MYECMYVCILNIIIFVMKKKSVPEYFLILRWNNNISQYISLRWTVQLFALTVLGTKSFYTLFEV